MRQSMMRCENNGVLSGKQVKAGDTMLRDNLCEVLNSRNGEIQPMTLHEEKYWKTALDIRWKGDVHFVVMESLFRRNLGHYYVLRDAQLISPDYTYTRINDALFKKLQGIIDEIDSGKYRNKKTLREKILELVQQKGLVSCMNNTKWNELLTALHETVPNIELQYKTLFEENPPEEYWELFGDEEMAYVQLAEIEWLKIRHCITHYTHRGALLPPGIQTNDKKEEILQILHTYNIPYEYDEAEQVFIVYGYR